ncbi:MFS transporter [Cellulomonas hominis]|uniref:MFS transporter n=1 Tax=Cellulomonas hominis TaxID=156981 RepID=UPI001C106DF6|nr:MFS transporter [Cellulomonas hominis]MBU5421211.1 MFS transporter [Cellulomonas hominis]
MSTPRSTARRQFSPWLIILGVAGCGILLTTALCNTAGLFLTPVMEESGWSRTAASLYFTIFAWVAAALGPVAARVLERFDARWVMSVIVVAFCGAYVWSASFTALWQWNVFGVIYGVCAAFFMYLAQPVIISRWFRTRMGMALALVGVISGVLGFFVSPWIQAMIDADGWRHARLWAGIVTVLVCLPLTILFVRNSPEELGQRPYGADEPAPGADPAAEVVQPGVPLRAAVKSLAFSLFLVFGFLSVVVPSLNQQIPSYAAAAPLGAMAGAFALSVLSIIGLPRNPLAGWFYDRFSGMAGNALCYAIATVGLGLVILGGGTNRILFYVGVAAFSFCFVPLTIGTPVFAREVFGARDFAQIYSWVTTVVLIAGGVAPLLYAQVFDHTGSYEALLWLGLVLSAVQVALVLAIRVVGRRLDHHAHEPGRVGAAA